MVVKFPARTGIGQELVVGDAEPFGHEKIPDAQRFAAGADETHDMPVVDDLHPDDRQQKAPA